MSKNKKNANLGYVLIASLLLLMGLSFIIFKSSLKTLGIVLGIVVAVYGTVLGIMSVASKKRGFDFAVKIAVAAACVIVGVSVAVLHEKAVPVFSAVLCALLIVNASFKLNVSAMCKRYSVRAWWVLLIPSLLVIAGSFWMIKYPPKSVEVTSVILGIVFLLSAINDVISIPYSANLLRKQSAEIYYDVYRKDMEASEKKK